MMGRSVRQPFGRSEGRGVRCQGAQSLPHVLSGVMPPLLLGRLRATYCILAPAASEGWGLAFNVVMEDET